MTPEEAVKNLRVLVENVSVTDSSEMVLRATLREVKNVLAKTQERPTPTVRGIPSTGRKNPLQRG